MMYLGGASFGGTIRKKKHLTLEERNTIELRLKERVTFGIYFFN